MSGQVRLGRQGRVARVTLSHAGKFNAMSRPMWRELRAAFTAIGEDSALRCVVVCGEQGNFCAGGDISEYPGFRFDAQSLRDFHENDVWGGLQAVLDCDLPVIAQIDGNCMGAGVEIACCCDLRLAGQSARFGAPIARLGFPMAPREAALVLREAGALTAREMLLGAGVLAAEELHARGFLNQVMPDVTLADQVDAMAQRIAALAPQAAAMNKRTLRALQAPADSRVLDALLERAYDYAGHAEHREGIEAFLAKRPANFENH